CRVTLPLRFIITLLNLILLPHAYLCAVFITSGHSLRYYHTTVSSPDHELPQYTSVGYVDGIQITRYSSDTGQTVPVAHWMERLEPEYWEEETQNNKQAQEASRRNVKIAMSRYNHTAGFHSFQDMYGCELRDDGSTRGYWQFGYGGNDFLTLDTERWVYYPITDQAQVSAQKWNDLKVRVGERAKDYLEKDCIKWLETYMEYGKEELDRKVHPQVKVSSHQSGSTMKLHCQVYGFYPGDVDVNWMKNEKDYILPYEAKHVLPNSDGTYQTRITVEVTPEDGASYFCHVDHSSLNETLIIMLGNIFYSQLILCMAMAPQRAEIAACYSIAQSQHNVSGKAVTVTDCCSSQCSEFQ
uniref:Ig-like domain-containing protein n=1 Tax=Leptobrachium leishanense TaxID=445787 RepID=A0A8C5WJJ4_9ANUR